jgi:hypothetical protein
MIVRRSVVAAVIAFGIGCSANTREIPSDDGFRPNPGPGNGIDSSVGPGPDGGFGEIDPGLYDTGPEPDATCAATQAAAIKPPVDIIMSVDQSGSMDDDIANVKNNVAKLTSFLSKSGLDWRLVMIATPGNGTYHVCVPPPIARASCASNPPTFLSVNQNVQSHDTLRLTLSTYPQWQGTLRKEAIKVFVPVTDDDSRQLAHTSFDAQLLALSSEQFGTATRRNYVYYPIIGAEAHPKEGKCGRNAVNNGAEYLALAKLTKGKWFSICLTDFGPVFEEIAKNVATRVACELTIPPPPSGETFDKNKVNVNWTPSAGGTPNPILKDDAKPCEGGANGWQYSPDGTKVLLCGDACAKVQADSGAKVNVEFGCATNNQVPS